MAMAPERIGIGIRRHFTTAGVHPYDEVTWELRDARITNFRDGSVAFEQLGVEVPSFWSQNATNILAQKYFRGQLGTAERETSLKQVADRVADTIANWGIKDGYFVDAAEAEAFRDELKYLIVHQRGAFNSPVWFNIGVKGVPQQASACFILAVEDTMDAILDWYKEEGTIFKGGSGSGINLSRIRSSKEHLKGGGTASGPVSFMRGADASAGTIKCLHEDTLIQTVAGRKPIRDVVVGDLVATRAGIRPVSAVHNNGIQPLVRLTTSDGETIECTPEHRFWVRSRRGEGWTEAGKLELGDAVLVDLSAPDVGTERPLVGVAQRHHNEIERSLPETLDEVLGLWLGWIWGDGSVTTAGPANFVGVEIGDDDPELIERYSRLTRTLFGDVNLFRSRHTDKPCASTSVRFCSTQVIRFLELNGLRKAGTPELFVPSIIFDSPARVRASFLCGLFEADGHVANGYAMFSTVSSRLAIDVRRLLVSIGIPARAGRIDDRESAFGDAPIHTVRVIGGEGMRRFEKLVGFISDRKSVALFDAVNRRCRSPYERDWHLPHVEDEIQALWRTGSRELRRAIAPYARYQSPRSLSLLRAGTLIARFPDELEGTAIDDFAMGTEYWSPVTVVTGGRGRVFDLTVEDAHEYQVHNVVTHNSGGKTRRAAKMVILNSDHPDIEDFIWCKAIEERKARALRDAGFDMDLDGRDSHSIQYQNANNSVRVTDEFMQAVVDDADWHLRAVTTGEVLETVKARDLFRQISKAAWECADPGLQYDSTINRWHTAANTGRINASNPCSEYVHLDNSACNLASINLLRFLNDDDTFDVPGYRAAIEIFFTAQEILVGNADYPTERIDKTTRKFRQLGLGYANLGALLMALGLPYDSDAGRAYAGALTALLTGHAYATSALTAMRMGPFAGYAENAEPMNKVLQMHRDAVANIDEELVPTDLLCAAQEAWDTAVELGALHGVRNSQATVLAPTGTISFLLDCDTTGIEPDLGLVKSKKLVGGGNMKIINLTVPRALTQLGYSPDEISVIVAYIAENDSIVGAPGLKAEHLPVFACSMGDNTIHYSGHVKMMGAVQPFISGAISKCIVGESLIATGDGLVRIGRLHDGEIADSFRDEIIEVASIGGHQKTDAFYYGGVRPVTEVTLRSGHRVIGTANHRVMVVGDGGRLDWKRLDEIGVGESVAVRYGADLWSPVPTSLASHVPANRCGSQKEVVLPTEMTRELAFLLGAFASEGHIERSIHTVTITNSDCHVRERLVRGWKSEFGLDARVAVNGERCPDVVVHSKTVVDFLEWLGCGTHSFNKRIPDAVLTSTRDHVLAFLQGLALDAYTTNGEMAKWAICLDSPRLLDDLQAVLTNLGIVHGRIAKYNQKYDKTCDEVYAAGSYAQRMARLVPFMEVDKAARAEALCARTLRGSNGADVIPGLTGRELHGLLPKGTSGGNEYGVHTPFSYLLDPRTFCVSRRSLERVAAVPGVSLPPHLRMILEDNLHFSPVVAVADAGEREVFDLSVPTTHAFIANGVVNHNTVNMPEDVTVEDVEQLHMDAWRLGLKAVAIYRDNCKVAQPLSTGKETAGSEAEAHDAELATKVAELEAALQRQTVVVKQPLRERLPRQRRSMTFKFRVADCEGYATVGEYEDGRPGEIFMQVSKQGSTLAGIMDAFAVAVSLGLQHGVPLATYVRKYTNTRFEPAGMTDDPDLRIASSLVDYVFRRLAVDYLSREEREELGILTTGERIQPTLPGIEESTTESIGIVETPALPEPIRDQVASATAQAVAKDAPYCYQCGNAMQRAGSCYVCTSCGTTSGCS